MENERSKDEKGSLIECSICFESRSKDQYQKLICCGGRGREERSTVKICNCCLLILSTDVTSSAQLQGIGGASKVKIARCPRCREWISLTCGRNELGQETITSIHKLDKAGTCKICRQVKDNIVDRRNGICDACFLGLRFPMIYECNRCHEYQRIPHPMYRYQRSVNDFGTVSWACQCRCGDYTYWRIIERDVPRIPASDVPEQWGDGYLNMLRERVAAETNRSNTRSTSSCTIS